MFSINVSCVCFYDNDMCYTTNHGGTPLTIVFAPLDLETRKPKDLVQADCVEKATTTANPGRQEHIDLELGSRPQRKGWNAKHTLAKFATVVGDLK